MLLPACLCWQRAYVRSCMGFRVYGLALSHLRVTCMFFSSCWPVNAIVSWQGTRCWRGNRCWCIHVLLLSMQGEKEVEQCTVPEDKQQLSKTSSRARTDTKWLETEGGIMLSCLMCGDTAHET